MHCALCQPNSHSAPPVTDAGAAGAGAAVAPAAAAPAAAAVAPAKAATGGSAGGPIAQAIKAATGRNKRAGPPCEHKRWLKSRVVGRRSAFSWI